MRPRYETNQDRENEKLISEIVEKHLSMKANKMPVSYILDYFMTQGGNGVAVLEVKARKIESSEFDDVFLSVKKWNEGIRYAMQGYQFLMAFGMLDGVYLFEYHPSFNNDLVRTIYGGRALSQRDSADVEPICLLPVKWMVKISGINVHEPRGIR